jgi:hypothetical protein
MKSYNDESWPKLLLSEWAGTYLTLHRLLQIVGKVRLASTPPLNHTWHVPLYLTARGLTTSPIPCTSGTFEIRVDLLDHNVHVDTSEGQRKSVPLYSRSGAEFYVEVMGALRSLGVDVHIWPRPVEMADETPLDTDERLAVYDPLAANRCFRVLSSVDQAFKTFMGRFLGKQSPSQFFWGSFDLAQTRFSGRLAPLPAHADWLRRECYSHELLSFGFWPGNEGVADAAFYAYAVPEPPGFKEVEVWRGASYEETLGEFLLPYESVRRARHPKDELLGFLQSAYDAGSVLGRWDRMALARDEGPAMERTEAAERTRHHERTLRAGLFRYMSHELHPWGFVRIP